MAMKLYHGSKRKIEKPIYQGSKKDNDYGPAFYMTQDYDSAGEWACRNNSVGFINEYNLETRGLKVLNLTDSSTYSVLNWLAILLHFRKLNDSFVNSFSNRLRFIEDHYYIDVNDYDMVIGFRADDAYFRFPLDFIRGNLTLEQLEFSFKLGNLGIQCALISEKAIEHLTFVSAFEANEIYIGKYFNNVKETTIRFNNLNKDEEGTRIFDIIRNNK